MSSRYVYQHAANDWREVPADGGFEGGSGPVVVGYTAIHRQVLVVAVVSFYNGEPIDGARFYVTPVEGENHERETGRWQNHGSKNQRVGEAVMGATWEQYNGKPKR